VYFPEHQYPEHLCENSKIYILGFKKTLVIVGVKKERKASPKSSTRYKPRSWIGQHEKQQCCRVVTLFLAQASHQLGQKPSCQLQFVERFSVRFWFWFWL